jgi:uncharacterized protein (TIGR00266 family)
MLSVRKTQKRQSTKKSKRVSRKSNPKNETPETSEVVVDSGYNIDATIPEHKIYNKPASASVVFNIKEGQSVYGNAGTMVWMDRDLKVVTKSRGILKGIKRALLTDDSFFLTSYEGVSKEGNKICFAPPLTGDMFAVKINPGEKKLVLSGGVVCCSENVIMDSRTRFRGFFANTGMFLSELIVPKESNTYGMAWIASYSGVEVLDIKEGQKMNIDNGHFLMCDGNVNYTLARVGGLKSTFFSGEGIVLKFEGPCKVYIQNRNTNSLVQFIASRLPKKKSFGIF